jgi:alginate O-acetyltransferase complex protein AlgI
VITEITDNWKIMCALALTLFLCAKWVTLLPRPFPGQTICASRRFAYVFLWPGMDARSFCGRRSVMTPPTREWLFAAAKTLLGAALLWGGMRLTAPIHSLVTGWLGMFSLVLLLHFGVFHLLSLAWRRSGITARPIMQSPLTATSLSQFWGRGWNTAFSDLMNQHVFRSLLKYLSPRASLFTIFLISGGLHELVLTVPAGGGYGLPTLYFSIQGAGVLFERSSTGRKLGLGLGWKGWCFVALIAGTPSLWLFPSVFIRNVMLPMLKAFGAT